MKKLAFVALAVGTALASSPSHAVLQLSFQNDGTTFACADGQACDGAGPANQIQLTNFVVGDYRISGTFAESSADQLTASNLTILNTTSSPATLNFAVGATGFTGPVTQISMSGAGSFINSIGGTGALSFHADAGNAQGAATPSDLPGTLLLNPSTSVTTNPQSFSANGILEPFTATGPFSMTEGMTITLPGGGSLIGAEQGMTAITTGAIPEPQTWAMMGLGFAALGFLGWKRRAPVSTRFAF